MTISTTLEAYIANDRRADNGSPDLRTQSLDRPRIENADINRPPFLCLGRLSRWFLSLPLVVSFVTASITTAAQAQAVTAATWYVSPPGNDTWSGTLAEPNAARTDGPKATLAAAIEASRTVSNDAKQIIVAEGVFCLDRGVALDKRDSSLTIKGAGMDLTVFYGGKLLEVRQFKTVAAAGRMGGVQLDRIDPAARKKVMVFDLKTAGLDRIPNYPDRFTSWPDVPELFFNGDRQTVARWPNDDSQRMAEVVELVGKTVRIPGANQHASLKKFRYNLAEDGSDRLARWKIDRGVWLFGYFGVDWYNEVVKIESVDLEKQQITLAVPTRYGDHAKKAPAKRRYYAMNLLEELDAPGEYYVDVQDNLLYFWPPSPIESAEVVLSTVRESLLTTQDTSNMTVRGITFAAGIGNGLVVNGGNRNKIEACKVYNVAKTGIAANGGTKHQVLRCEVHDTGTNGIVARGGDRKTLTPAGHEVLDCHVWRFGRLKTVYSPGISLGDVGNRAAHNHLHDSPHMAVGISGNDHIFELNRIHDVCLETDDAGGLYKGRNPSCRGNQFRYNFWHDIGTQKTTGYGTSAIFLDDGDGGELIYGNVFLRCGYRAGVIKTHGGHDNVAENNIFIDCQRAFVATPWNDEHWKLYINADLWQKRLLKEVDITKPPYTTRYPKLIGFMNPRPGDVRNNYARNNVYVNCDEITRPNRPNWEIDMETSLVTDADPGFVDATGGDYALKPNSEVFRCLPNFKPIPFDSIGPRRESSLTSNGNSMSK